MDPERRYADVLRVVGKYLDAQHARTFEIIEHETYMSVSWDEEGGGAGNQPYSQLDILDLVEAARLMRGSDQGRPLGERAELLRTLGQELDREIVELDAIFDEENAYQVRGVANGQDFGHRYLLSELRGWSSERRAKRSAAPAAEPADAATEALELEPIDPEDQTPTEEIVDPPPPSLPGRAPWWHRILGG